MRCFALVQLDTDAGRLLSARARPGDEASWVHRCQLAHGHGGDHHCVDPTTECALDWDDFSTAPRITAPRTAAPQPAAEQFDAPPPVEKPASPRATVTRLVNGAEHPVAQVAVRAAPSSRTEVEALDAIASALERICDVFHSLVDDPDGGVGRIWHQRADSMNTERRGHTR